ncbi:MAG: DUF998 domain-containing protein [Thermoplasmata archaeon]|nr:DUF998 domain-containing protein [Thermoplasmata archaeon]
MDRTAVRWFALGGAAAPLVYLLAVLIGGLLWPSYSHYAQTVSTLTASGAPNQSVVIPLFALYNVLVFSLAFGLWYGIDRRDRPPFGPVFLAGVGAGGLILFAFPQDLAGPPVTFTGTLHVVVAGAIALLSLLAMASCAREFGRTSGWVRYATASWVGFAALLVLGGIAAATISAPFAGVAERASIGTILAWMGLVAVGLWRSATRAADVPSATAGPRDAVASNAVR